MSALQNVWGDFSISSTISMRKAYLCSTSGITIVFRTATVRSLSRSAPSSDQNNREAARCQDKRRSSLSVEEGILVLECEIIQALKP